MSKITLTGQEVVEILNYESKKFKLIKETLVDKYIGDMSIEETYEYIFELQETKDHYIFRINIGDTSREDMFELFFFHL